MTYADFRKSDPALLAVLRHMASVNVQNPDFDAIKKILIEGADGRYLKEVMDDDFRSV
jgi:hypothetical protein